MDGVKMTTPQKPHGLGMTRGNRGMARKARILSLSLDEFIGWVCDGKCRRIIGIPPGSRVIGALYDLVTNSLEMAVENESFAEVGPGQPIPMLSLEMRFQDCSEKEE